MSHIREIYKEARARIAKGTTPYMEMPKLVFQPTTIKLLEEKYGGPLNQDSLAATLDFYHQRKISLEMIAQKMYHLVAIPFKIENRNFIPKG